MITNKYLNKKIDLEALLSKHKIDVELKQIKKIYNHHSKYYHNFDHIEHLLSIIEIDDDQLIIAILFHDIMFDVRSENHEKASAEFFYEHCFGEHEFKDKVYDLIMATENIHAAGDALTKEIMRVDRLILHKTDINSLLTWEKNIFSEHQYLPVKEYKKGRVAFLNRAYEETGNATLLELRDIVSEKVYKIGFYPGSFNPFHIGHYNILKKSEKSFDKVVIGVGINYDKRDIEKVAIPDTIKNREIIYYNGLITTEIQNLSQHGEVFVVRGLRNAYDLQHEEGLRNVIKDFLPDQEFVYYFCDKEYEHISSSLIRDIQSRGKEGVGLTMTKKYLLE
ncbi:hypothetical protein EZV73_09265 [Acidaminobacter sp. JC074]|uniref:adenylyltransferase/cytidyltransferase family protein n=1 Tax=Acidaminobacter sp. JC074 TaxID=2530199 RepID=UPI001F0F73D1|nr:adenylyltransferase/cytidyltransferase family protein [Acidaminobacter sp. JC074]MCH4887762.1 hypothetical protein [Acidaminobacter sp. JC074]